MSNVCEQAENVTPAYSVPSEGQPGASSAGLIPASNDPQTSPSGQMSCKRPADQQQIRKYHTQMVVKLGDMFSPKQWRSICNQVKMMEYVSTRDMGDVESMEDLCLALKGNGVIRHGEYSNLREILVTRKVEAGDIIDDFTSKIRQEMEGPSPAKQARTGDIVQQQSAEIHPDLKPMIDTTKARINKDKEERKFYTTKGFRDAKDKLLEKKVVIIKGNTGDGKTAIAVQLIHWLNQEKKQDLEPLQIHNIEKLDLLTRNLKLITFIDDIFGEKDVCKKDVQEWNKRISVIKTCFVDEEATNFLVITIRNEVYNSLETCSCEIILTDDHTIDLSSDIYKIEEEKKALLELYMPKEFSDEEKDKIVTCAPNIGFPQCCHLFSISVELQKERVNFFENPFHFFEKALSKLPECSALLYLFFNDGMIKVKDLDPNSQNVNKKLLEEAFDISVISGQDDSSKLKYKKKVTFVKESLKKLSGFLVMTGKHWRSGEDVYRFHHDSIYVAVALLYGKATTVGYIQNCPSKCLSYLTTSKTATNMIVISSDHYTEMCERLLREFECTEWRYETSVCSLDVWKDPVFVKRFVSLLNEKKVDKLGVLNKACWFGAEECALYLLSEGVKPDKDTALSLVGRHWNDGNKQLCLLKEIVVYLNDETKLAVLNEACRSGAEECALYLLSEGVKPNKYTDLWWLVRSRHWIDGNKQLCLLKEIVVYMNDETKLDVLNEACRSGAEECALYLLCEGRVNPDKATVFRVVEGGSIELLRKLLEYDVTPTARGGLGGNVLHEACGRGREEMVTLICDTYPHLVHDTDGLGQTPLHRVAEEGSLGLFQMMERFVLNSLYRVENQQTKCESVNGCVVHKYCVCAQYMSQFPPQDRCRLTVLHYSCGAFGGGVNREVCLYLCRSYPGLIPIVDKDGWHCLHCIALNTSDVDVFTECETYVKQYVESTGGKYDVTTILTNRGKSVLDLAKGRAKYLGCEDEESENNPLLEHLVKVFGK